ncbi:unnamed protein product, partial [Meganyctiphanes norvegica]
MLPIIGCSSTTSLLASSMVTNHLVSVVTRTAWQTPRRYRTGCKGPRMSSSCVRVDLQQLVYLYNGDGGVSAPTRADHEGVLSTVLLVLVLLLIIVGTVVGNLLVCVAVCLVRKLRRPYNYLLVSLAVSDLCVAILVMPMAMLHELLGQWQFGRLACDVWVSFDVLSCTASILNLCMISVDRYLAITKPLEYGAKRTPARMFVYISVVWVGAAFISVPPVLILGNEHGNGEVCEVCQNFWYQIYATSCSFYIPLSVMVTVYYKIFMAAKKIVDDERRAQAHLRLMEAADSAALRNDPQLLTYTQLKHVSRYSVVEVNNGGVETKLAQDAAGPKGQPKNYGRPEAAKLTRDNYKCLVCGPNGEYVVPGPMTVSATSMSTTASGDASTVGSRWSLIESNGKLHYPPPIGKVGAKTMVSPPYLTTCNYSTCYATGNSACYKLNHHGSSGHVASRPKAHYLRSQKERFSLAKERKASTTLGIIMSAFVVCWLPFFLTALVKPFLDQPTIIPDSVSSLFLWLGYANSLLNPIIYATLNKDFRKPFQQVLLSKCLAFAILVNDHF